MAVIYFDGWDSYATADIPKRWSVFNGSYTVASASGRNGTGCLHVSDLGGSRCQRLISTTGLTTLFVGFAVKLSAIPLPGTPTRFFSLLASDGNYQLGLYVNGGGSIELRSGGATNGTGTLIASYAAGLVAGVFYYIEIGVTISNAIAANSCNVKLNGVTAITPAAGTNLRPNTTIASASYVEFGGQAGLSSAGTGDWDDFYVCDNSGSANNTFLGDRRVEIVRPTGAGTTTQFTPDTGSNYARVNESAQDGDTSYVATNVVGNLDTYQMGDLSSSPSSVAAVQVVILGRKDDAGSRSIASAVRSGGTNYDHGATNPFGLADGYTTLIDVWETDPATGAAWTGTGVNAMEAGVKLVN